MPNKTLIADLKVTAIQVDDDSWVIDFDGKPVTVLYRGDEGDELKAALMKWLKDNGRA